jgi:hypothetical protein
MAGKKTPKKAARSKEERSDRMVEQKAAKAKKEVQETPLAPAGTPINVSFSNTSASEALLYLEDRSGLERFILMLEPAKSSEQSCKSPANWTVKMGGKELKVVANRDKAQFEIGADKVKAS